MLKMVGSSLALVAVCICSVSTFAQEDTALLSTSPYVGAYDEGTVGDQGHIRHTAWPHPRPISASALHGGGQRNLRGESTFLSVNDDPEGDMPHEVKFLADGSAAVIVNRDTGNVCFFDIPTVTITDTVAVGDHPVDLAVTPDNRYVVVPNVLSNNVSIVDVATRTLVTDIPITGEQPFSVDVTSDSSTAIIGVINDGVDSSFSVIDLNTLSEVRSFASVPQGTWGTSSSLNTGTYVDIYTQFALTRDDQRIVALDYGNAQVAIYDIASGNETLIATAAYPHAVDVSTDGTFAVVAHYGSDSSISVIDLNTCTLTSAFEIGYPMLAPSIRLTPDGAYAMALGINGTLSIDTATGESSFLSTYSPWDIELTFDGQYAFVAGARGYVIDVPSQTVVGLVDGPSAREVATSPTQHRAVTLDNLTDDSVYLNYISWPFLEGQVASGALPEADKPWNLGVAPDGSVAITCNEASGNVSIIDMATRAVRSYVDVGEWPMAAAITPDGAYAVVCAGVGEVVQIIDLSTDTVVKSLPTDGPIDVRISPDGQYAYAVGVNIDMIRLDGANSESIAQLPAGATSTIWCLGTYRYAEYCGMELSHDGSIVAVCASSDDVLNLFDTTTHTQVASVPAGEYPIRVAFSPDDSYAYVTSISSKSLSVIAVDGANSYCVTNIDTNDIQPLVVQVDATGDYVYVGNAESVLVIDTSTNTVVKTVAFPDGDGPRDGYLSWTDGMFYAATINGKFVRMAADGPDSEIVEWSPTTSVSFDLAFDNNMGVALLGLSIADGVDVFQFGCAEDLDGDREVDLSDLATLLSNYGGSDLDRTDGDLDGDGDVDLSDLATLLAAYGGPCP